MAVVVTAIDFVAVQVVPASHDSWTHSRFVPVVAFKPLSARTWSPPIDSRFVGTPSVKSQYRWRSFPPSVQLVDVFVPLLVSVATAAFVVQPFAGVDS